MGVERECGLTVFCCVALPSGCPAMFHGFVRAWCVVVDCPVLCYALALTGQIRDARAPSQRTIRVFMTLIERRGAVRVRHGHWDAGWSAGARRADGLARTRRADATDVYGSVFVRAMHARTTGVIDSSFVRSHDDHIHTHYRHRRQETLQGGGGSSSAEGARSSSWPYVWETAIVSCYSTITRSFLKIFRNCSCTQREISCRCCNVQFSVLSGLARCFVCQY